MPPSLGVAQDPFPLFLAPRAYAVCACEPDTDFTFVLDLILNGAQKLKGTRKRQTQRDLLIPSSIRSRIRLDC